MASKTKSGAGSRRARSTTRKRAVVHLPKGGPPVGEATPPRKLRGAHETHPLVGADVGKIQAILLAAFSGRPGQLMDLYDDARDRDARLDAVCRIRTLALVGRPWSVKPPRGMETDPVAKFVAEQVSDIIAGVEEWELAVGFIADGILRGYSVTEIIWGVDRQGRVVPQELKWRHPNRFAFDEQMRIVKYDYGDPYPGVRLDSFGEYKFIVHSPTSGRAAYPMRRGALLGTVFPALTKRYGLRWWLKAAERFGQPLPYVKLPQGAGPQLKEEALAMLRHIHADWEAVVWGGIELGTFPGSGGKQGETHQALVELINREVAIAILGQNLTTEVDGGSLAATEAHNLVRQDLLAADAMEIAATIRRHLIQPIVEYNWPGAPVPLYEMQLTAKKTKEIFAYHMQFGVVTIDEVRDSLGLPPLPNGMGTGLIEPMVEGGPPEDTSMLAEPPGGGTSPLSGGAPVSVDGGAGAGGSGAGDGSASDEAREEERYGDWGALTKEQEEQAAVIVGRIGRLTTRALLDGSEVVKHWPARLAAYLLGADGPDGARSAVDRWARDLEHDRAFAGWHYRTGLHAAMAAHLMVRAIEVPETTGKEARAMPHYRAPAVPFVDMDFEEAIADFARRKVMTPAQFNALRDRFRDGGFTATQLASRTLRERAFESILSMLEGDATMPEVISAIRNEEVKLGVQPAHHDYLDTVVRTNVATAYGSGRFAAMTDPAVLELRPFWQYRAVGDAATRPTHRALDGKVFEAGSDPGRYYYPPLGYRCRCNMVTLSERAVKQAKLTVVTAQIPGLDPDEGFEGEPAPVT